MSKIDDTEEVVRTLGLRGIIILILSLFAAIPASIGFAFWIDGRYAHDSNLKTLQASNEQLANHVIELKQTTNQLKVYVDVLADGKFKLSKISDTPPPGAFVVPKVAVAAQPEISPDQLKELEAFKASILAVQPATITAPK